MHLLALPNDILQLILGRLDTKSLLTAACTCSTFRQLSMLVPSLRPNITPSNWQLLSRWLARDHVKKRVTVLRASRALGPAHRLALAEFVNLRMFSAICCKIHASIFHNLPQSSLLCLSIHRLSPATSDVFSTKLLKGFTRLRRLYLTFGPGWSIMVITEGLPKTLEVLQIRRIPVLLIKAPLPAISISLHAFETIVAPQPLSMPHCHMLFLQTDEDPLDLTRLLPMQPWTLRRLILVSPGFISFPSLEEGNALTDLEIDTGMIRLPDMRALTNLKRLRVHVHHSFIFDTISLLPAGLEKVDLRHAGRPLRLSHYF